MSTHSFLDICQVWQRQAYRGTVLLQNPEDHRCIYFVLRAKQVAFISDDPPTDSGVIDLYVQLMGRSEKGGDSPSQFLDQAFAAKLFNQTDFNNALTKYLLDRMYALISQVFVVKLEPELSVDINYGVDIDYLLKRLTDKQLAWHQYITNKFKGEQLALKQKEQQNLTLADLVSFPLNQAQNNTRVYLHRLHCEEHNPKLLGMGFAPGVGIEVVNSLPNGGVMVGLQEQRLGLGAEMAAGIAVIDSKDWQQVKLMRDEKEIKLAQAPIGAKLRVLGYKPTAREYKRKLLAMGLTPGVDILVKRHAPLGDPTEIEVRGFALSLRKDEADALRVTLITGGEP